MKTITAILQSQLLHHVAQPIWNIQNHTLFGYECLLRSTFSINPEQMFQQAILEKENPFQYENHLIHLHIHSVTLTK
jgi:EAL domain-containing protein (putative c-di-GMP-specific phosphodiesterase class I)